MRFGIQDLLLLTTLAAIYCAGLMALPSQTPAGFSSNAIVLPFSMMVIVPVAMAWRRHQQLGRAKVHWRAKYWWAPHIAFASIFIAYVVWGVLYGINAGPIMPAMSLTHHAMFFAWSQLAVGENGVLVGTALLRWEDYRFEIDQEAERIRFAWRGDFRRRGWTQPQRGDIVAPKAAIEAVAAHLASQQSSETQPPMNADQRG